MTSRRKFLRSMLYCSGILGTGLGGSLMARSAQPGGALSVKEWYMPDEGEPHLRTWMAFGAQADIWSHELLPAVQSNLALIANTIAKYEPVSVLVRKHEYDLARSMMNGNVSLVVAPMDDLWIRDTGPVFVVTEQGDKAAVDLNFNGWGEKQDYDKDAEVAALIAQNASVALLNTDLILEGGCIEVDGHGTAIITESCTLNSNRNPGVSKAQFEDALMPLLGLDKIHLVTRNQRQGYYGWPHRLLCPVYWSWYCGGCL